MGWAGLAWGLSKLREAKPSWLLGLSFLVCGVAAGTEVVTAALSCCPSLNYSLMLQLF